MTIGDKILSCRKKAGMSQETLAAQLHISRQAVSRWETGEATPDTEKVIQLSRIFQVSTDYLLLDEIEEPDQREAATDTLTEQVKERRRSFRIFFGKSLLFGGMLFLIAVLIGAGFYANAITSWYTAWGRYGTALFRTWFFAVPLFVTFCATIVGGYILLEEYRRED